VSTTTQSTCMCGDAPRLIFACSGASDVGEITDRAARLLTPEDVGRMYGTAGIGGLVSGILATARAASAILALDGCLLNCAQKSLKETGFTTFAHLRLADLGMEKGATPPTEAAIRRVADGVEARLMTATCS